ncbi:unnamed protein product, partial [Polarella glacialis]
QRGAVLLSFNRSIEVFSNGQRGSDLPPYNQSLQSMVFPALMLLLALSVAAYSLYGRLVCQRNPDAMCRKEEDEDDHKEKTKLCLRLESATKVHCWKADDLPALGVSFMKEEICGSTPCAKAIADYSDMCAAHPTLMSEPMTLSMYQMAFCPGLHKHYEHCSTGMRDPRIAWRYTVTCQTCKKRRALDVGHGPPNSSPKGNGGVLWQRGAVLPPFNHSIEVFSNGRRGSDLPPYNQSLQSMVLPALMLLLALSVAAYSLCYRLVRQRPPLAMCRKEEDEEDHKELICQSESA